MVVVDQDHPIEMETKPENVESESKISDSENINKAESKSGTESPPSELERLKVFTRKVARCAAKSFCETYVHPLVIKNPNTLSSKSENAEIQNLETQREILLNAGPGNEEDQTIIIKPKQEEEDKENLPLSSPRQEMEKEHDRQSEVVNPNKKKHILAATVNVINEEQMIIIDKRKPSLSIDIANILSYLPCQSLIAVSEENDEDIEAAADLEIAEPAPCDANCKCSKTRIKEDETEPIEEEASPTEEI